MRTPANLRMPKTGDSGEMRLSTVEQRQIPAWKVALLRARQAEKGEAEFSDAPPVRGAALNDMQRRSIEDSLKRELPRFDRADGETGRPMTPHRPYDAKGRLRRQRAPSEVERLEDYSLSATGVLMTGLAVMLATGAVAGILALLWLLATALQAL